jgi:hypothetical protein
MNVDCLQLDNYPVCVSPRSVCFINVSLSVPKPLLYRSMIEKCFHLYVMKPHLLVKYSNHTFPAKDTILESSGKRFVCLSKL